MVVSGKSVEDEEMRARAQPIILDELKLQEKKTFKFYRYSETFSE